MLHDLRTVTPVSTISLNPRRNLTREFKENHDAEAFLKPVLRAEVPDYYDGQFTTCLTTPVTHQRDSHITPHGSANNAEESQAASVQVQARI